MLAEQCCSPALYWMSQSFSMYGIYIAYHMSACKWIVYLHPRRVLYVMKIPDIVRWYTHWWRGWPGLRSDGGSKAASKVKDIHFSRVTLVSIQRSWVWQASEIGRMTTWENRSVRCHRIIARPQTIGLTHNSFLAFIPCKYLDWCKGHLKFIPALSCVTNRTNPSGDASIMRIGAFWIPDSVTMTHGQ